MKTISLTSLRRECSNAFDLVYNEKTPIKVTKNNNKECYLVCKEDYEMMARIKAKREAEQKEVEKQLDEIFENFKEQIKENQEKYPLSEEEYNEHMKRFERAQQHTH